MYRTSGTTGGCIDSCQLIAGVMVKQLIADLLVALVVTDLVAVAREVQVVVRCAGQMIRE